jgi:hypothetical protein
VRLPGGPRLDLTGEHAGKTLGVGAITSRARVVQPREPGAAIALMPVSRTSPDRAQQIAVEIAPGGGSGRRREWSGRYRGALTAARAAGSP